MKKKKKKKRDTIQVMATRGWILSSVRPIDVAVAGCIICSNDDPIIIINMMREGSRKPSANLSRVLF